MLFNFNPKKNFFLQKHLKKKTVKKKAPKASVSENEIKIGAYVRKVYPSGRFKIKECPLCISGIFVYLQFLYGYG